MKFSSERPYADPEKAARKLLEIANATEAPQEGRIHIEKINGPMLFKEGASPAEYKAGLDLASLASLEHYVSSRPNHRSPMDCGLRLAPPAGREMAIQKPTAER
jgi:hypothetical protein